MAERVELLCALTVLHEEARGYDAFLEEAAEVVGAHYGGGCALALLSDGKRVVNVIGAFHVDPAAHAELERFLEAPMPVLAGVEGAALDGGAGRIVALRGDALASRPEAQRYVAASGATHGAVVPMRARGSLDGLLWLSVRQTLTGDDLRFLEEVAGRIGMLVYDLRVGSGDVAAETAADAGPAGSLTGREREILTLVARGMTSRQIAAELVLSARTVEWHRSRIQAKLGVSGRAEMTRIALECHLPVAPP